MKQLTDRGFDEVAKRFRLLGDPGRLKILDLLRRYDEQSVGEIAAHMGCSQAHASRQLARLRDAGLLDRRQHGTTVYYRVAASWVFDLCQSVCGRLEDDSHSGRAPLFVTSSH